MIFAILTLLAALAVASVAGWFSIIGVMAIYAGAPYHAALVMGVVLELAKLVTTSWIYRNWEFANWKLKGPLIYFTAALMLATSIGVFGFLSKSHLEQGAKTVDNGPRVERIEQQITREKSTIADDEKVIAQLDATINSYLGKDRTDRSVSIRKSQAPQRKQLKDEIDAANKRIDGFSEEKFKLQSEIRALELEVGPIRYIAELMYGTEGNSTKNIEGAVKIFTLLIVSTLDPLAIILLVAANHTIMRRQNEKKQKIHTENTREPFVGDEEADEIFESNNIPSILQENVEGPNDVAKVDVSLQEESVGLVDEEEKIVIEESDKGEDRLPNSTDSDPIIIIREILEEKPTTEAEIEAKDTISEKVNEEETPVLERHSIIRARPALAIIRSPRPSKVSTKPDTVPTADSPAIVEAPVQKISTEIKNSRATQETVMRGLLELGPHFIPQKVNEEEENKVIEVSAANTETHTSSSTKETEEVPQEGQGKNQNAQDMESKDITPLHGTERHKYPKALSWLREFTRTQNE